MFLCLCSFWSVSLLPGRIACLRVNLLREDIVCFVLSISLYGIFLVFKNGPHIRVLCTRVSFVSGSTLHMKIYFDPYKKKRVFFPP
jgi:hypothetical protein